MPGATRKSEAVDTELSVEADAWLVALGGGERAEAFAASVVAAALTAARSPGCCATVSILLTDDARIRELNKNFRGKDKATDVLSWPSINWSGPASDAELRALPPGALLGDLALALETTQSDSNLYERDLEHHVAHLIVHGTLHLLGYDHEDESSAAEMEAVEESALRALGMPGRDD